jgi:hypothetical protein
VPAGASGARRAARDVRGGADGAWCGFHRVYSAWSLCFLFGRGGERIANIATQKNRSLPEISKRLAA